MGNTPKLTKVGVGWYTKDEWFKLCAVAADAGRLEETYEEWLKVFNKACADMLQAGILAVKVPVRVQDLIEWCKTRGLTINGEARAKFITEQLSKQPSTDQSPENPLGNEKKEAVRQALLEAVENQIRDGNPKETKLTLDRLVRQGHSYNEAMKLIASVLVREMNETLKTNKPFHEARYIKALKAL
jgi:hypothetical protein